MTKVVILSDNHFQRKEMMGILEKHRDATAIIHCGDSQYSVNDEIFNGVITVKGNNDFQKFDREKVVKIDGLVFYISHGHEQYVYFDTKPNVRGTNEFVEHARTFNADIAIYGHTHVAEVHEHDGVLVINPGSTNFPRSFTMRQPSYAILTIEGNQRDVRFYHSKTHEDITDVVIS